MRKCSIVSELSLILCLESDMAMMRGLQRCAMFRLRTDNGKRVYHAGGFGLTLVAGIVNLMVDGVGI